VVRRRKIIIASYMNGSFHYLAVIGWHNWGIKQSECISDILLVVPTDKCLIRYNAARSIFPIEHRSRDITVLTDLSR
jgi:hypothetical protein